MNRIMLLDLWNIGEALVQNPAFARGFSARASRESTVAGFWVGNINLSLFSSPALIGRPTLVAYKNPIGLISCDWYHKP